MPTHHNLFLMTAIPALLVAWWSKSFSAPSPFHGLRGPDALPWVVLMAHEPPAALSFPPAGGPPAPGPAQTAQARAAPAAPGTQR